MMMICRILSFLRILRASDSAIDRFIYLFIDWSSFNSLFSESWLNIGAYKFAYYYYYYYSIRTVREPKSNFLLNVQFWVWILLNWKFVLDFLWLGTKCENLCSPWLGTFMVGLWTILCYFTSKSSCTDFHSMERDISKHAHACRYRK